MLVPLVFLSLCSMRCTAMSQFGGFSEESIEEFRREVCDLPITSTWNTEDELLDIMNGKRTNRDSQVPVVGGGHDAKKNSVKWIASFFNNVTEEKNRLESNLADTNRAFEEIKEENSELERTLREKVSVFNNVTEEKDRLESNLADTNRELEQLRVEYDQLKRTVADRNKDLEELRARKELQLSNLGDEVGRMLEQAMKEFPEATHLVTLQVEIDGDSIPDIHILLLGKESPHTVEKFLKLCDTLYKDSKIDIVEGGRWIEGGSFSSTGHFLDYRGKKFPSDPPSTDWRVGDVAMAHIPTVGTGYNLWFGFYLGGRSDMVRVGRVLDTSPGSGLREIERRAEIGNTGWVTNNIIVINITTTSLSAPIIMPV